jgi:hypothetical protein
MRVSRFTALLLIAFCASLPAIAQEAHASAPTDLSYDQRQQAKEMATRYFRLQVSVHELDGTRVINHRDYSVIAAAEAEARPVSIRSGDRIPTTLTTKGAADTEYLDLGVDVDVQNIEMHGDRLALRIDGHLNSLADPSNTNSTSPVIRRNSWGSRVLIPIGKPEIIFSSDDPSTTHRFQVEITAVEIN